MHYPINWSHTQWIHIVATLCQIYFISIKYACLKILHKHKGPNKVHSWANKQPSHRLQPTDFLAAWKPRTVCWKSFRLSDTTFRLRSSSRAKCRKLVMWILSELAPHWVRCWVVFAVGHCCLSKLLQLSRRLEGFFVFCFLFCFVFFNFCCFQDCEWRKTEPSRGRRQGRGELCRDVCRSDDSGKHAPNPSRGLTLLTPPLFWRLQHFLVSARVPTQGSQVHL